MPSNHEVVPSPWDTPRDSESPDLFVYGSRSLRIPNAFPVALHIGDRNRPYAEPGRGPFRTGLG